ncbi:hypothetical protein, partial [Klebsiella pneumoniae]|uniref:hypothetical protein n=1 Tax=Klebsiella pneumoniae TaxID=573 RepID=UPI001C4A4AEC
FTQEPGFELSSGLVGSERCISDRPAITHFSLTISLLHRRSVANAIAIPFAPPPTTPDYITIKTKFGSI